MEWNSEFTLLYLTHVTYFSCESLALQDCNNKAPDDEVVTVQCLDIGACEQ